MHLRADTLRAWHTLKARPSLAIPQTLSLLFSLVFLYLLVMQLGILPLIEQYREAAASVAPAQLNEHLEQQGFGEAILARFTIDNFIYILTTFVLTTLASFYLGTLNYAAIALTTLGTMHWKEAFTQTHARIGAHLWLRMLQLGIILIPIVLVLSIAFGLLIFGHVLAGLLALVCAGFSSIAWVVYMSSRLTFCEPVLFLEQSSGYSALKKSMHITQQKLWDAFAIFAIIVGFSWVTSSLTYSPLVELLTHAALSPTAARLIATTLLGAFLLLVQAAAYTVRDLFVFYVYKEF